MRSSRRSAMKPSSTDFTPSRRAPRAPSGPTKSRVVHRAGDVDGEHDVAGRLAALDRARRPIRGGRGSGGPAPRAPSAKAICGHERGRTTAPSPLSRPALAPSKNGKRTRLHHLAARRGEPEHQERQRQRDERPGEGELKHGGGRIQWRRGGEQRRAVEGGRARRVGRGGEGRPERRRRRRRCGRGRRSTPSPVSAATSARGKATSAVRRSSRSRRARAPGSPAARAGARARSSASAARR